MRQDPKEYRKEWDNKQKALGRKKLVTHISAEASQALTDMAQWSGLKIVEIMSRALVAVGHRRELLFADDVVGLLPAPELTRTPPEAVQTPSMAKTMACQLKAIQDRLDALERKTKRAPLPAPGNSYRPSIYKMAPEEKTALLHFLAAAYAKGGKKWNRKALYEEAKNAGLQTHATFGGFTNFITSEFEAIKMVSGHGK